MGLVTCRKIFSFKSCRYSQFIHFFSTVYKSTDRDGYEFGGRDDLISISHILYSVIVDSCLSKS